MASPEAIFVANTAATPEALVWRGGRLMVQSGKGFGRARGGELWARGLGVTNMAGQLRRKIRHC